MSKPIINLADVALRDIGNGTSFRARAARIGAATGMKQLGCQMIVVEPGQKAYPFHNHRANEEMFVILEGSGTYRCGLERLAIKAGDIIAAPAGDSATAHQIINTGESVLRYLAISTRLDIEIVEYPDSGKFAAASEIPDGAGMMSARFGFIGRLKDSVDYYDGEA